MKKNTKSSISLAALTLLFTAGAATIGIFGAQAANELEANSFGKVARPGSSAASQKIARLVAQSQAPKIEAETCLVPATDKPVYSAQAVTQDIPRYVDPGAVLNLAIYVKNTGTMPWFGDASACENVPHVRLGTAREKDRNSILYNPGDANWRGANRLLMQEKRVNPGETATFTFSSHAPLVQDVFKEYFQPVVEGVSWLDSKEATVAVRVYTGSVTPEVEKQAKLLNRSGQASALDLSGDPTIHVNLTTQKVLVSFGDTVIREYMGSTGARATPTPTGTFKISLKQDLRIGAKAPHYRMPNFQLFTNRGHGFHALPYLATDNGVFWKEALNHIGQRVSHGCIRLLPEDAEDLYNITAVGWTVNIHY